MKKFAGNGFLVGFLAGLAFVFLRLLKYPDLARRSDLLEYVAVVLAAGVVGAGFVSLIKWVVRSFRRRE
jgi:hypothetical protein